jgi:hypothetical protein
VPWKLSGPGERKKGSLIFIIIPRAIEIEKEKKEDRKGKGERKKKGGKREKRERGNKNSGLLRTVLWPVTAKISDVKQKKGGEKKEGKRRKKNSIAGLHREFHLTIPFLPPSLPPPVVGLPFFFLFSFSFSGRRKQFVCNELISRDRSGKHAFL